ncbi:hypothetical protein ACLOJK_019099 [Asimina triloba]
MPIFAVAALLLCYGFGIAPVWIISSGRKGYHCRMGRRRSCRHGSGMETTPDLKRELLPVKIEDTAAIDGDAARDRLRSNQICTPCLVADGLDNSDYLNGVSTHCLDDEDAVAVDGALRIYRRWMSLSFYPGRIGRPLLARRSSNGSHGCRPWW